MIASASTNGSGGPPKVKEKTGAQEPISRYGQGVSLYGDFSYLEHKANKLRWSRKVREMMIEPTIALLQIKYCSAISAPGFSIDAKEDTPEEIVEFARELIEPIWGPFSKCSAMGCVNRGWQGFEKIYDLNEEGMWTIKKLKPLLHDLTSIQVDKDNGDWAGFKQGSSVGSTKGEVELDPDESMLVSFDVEGTNWYGRAPMKNLVAAFDQKKKIEENAEEYDGRVAAAHWVVYYPPGRTPTSYTLEGAVKTSEDNKDIADQVMAILKTQGHAVLPSYVEGVLNDLNDLKGDGTSEWRVELLTAARTGGTAPYDSRLKYKDVEFARGLGFQERSVFEGQFGTKAEADTHTQGNIDGIQDRADTIATVLTNQCLADVIGWNFGQQYRGSVRVIANPMTDAHKAFIADIYSKLLSNQELSVAEYDVIDTDQMKEKLEIPQRDNPRSEDDLSDGEDDEPDEDDSPKKDQVLKLASSCGANAEGGGGFQKGNTCAGGDEEVKNISELIEADQLISSQRFRDDDTVQEKIENEDFEVFISPMFEIDGDTFQVVLDGHHSLEAARKSGNEPEFTIYDKRQHDAIRLLDKGDIDGFLQVVQLDDDFYDIDTGRDVF